VNALLHYCGKDFVGIGGTLRPGIVHRLDKDTSGLMVVAKNDLAQQALMKQFKDRTVTKKYLTLVSGWIDQNEGLIDAAIERDVKNRKKMMVSAHLNAKEAKTDFRFLERFDHPKLGKFTYCEVNLLTGRTHQIRVHFTAIGFPLIGDVLYGRDRVNKVFEQEFGLTRQFLHAAELSFEQPRTGDALHLKSGLPEDLEKVLEGLRA
jgi:23S rRNA pseudouridine1911/1915/1917 synthase